MKSRLWNLDKDYNYLVKWWAQYDFGTVPKQCLPPEGIIVENNNTPICAGGLYRCVNSNFGVMEWIVADKFAPLKITHKALNLCIQELLLLAKTFYFLKNYLDRDQFVIFFKSKRKFFSRE